MFTSAHNFFRSTVLSLGFLEQSTFAGTIALCTYYESHTLPVPVFANRGFGFLTPIPFVKNLRSEVILGTWLLER